MGIRRTKRSSPTQRPCPSGPLHRSSLNRLQPSSGRFCCNASTEHRTAVDPSRYWLTTCHSRPLTWQVVTPRRSVVATVLSLAPFQRNQTSFSPRCRHFHSRDCTYALLPVGTVCPVHCRQFRRTQCHRQYSSILILFPGPCESPARRHMSQQ
jgi:hypothetical protein